MIIEIIIPEVLVIVAWWLVTLALFTATLGAIGCLWYYCSNWLFKFNGVYRFAVFAAAKAYLNTERDWFLNIKTSDGMEHKFKKVMSE